MKPPEFSNRIHWKEQPTSRLADCWFYEPTSTATLNNNTADTGSAPFGESVLGKGNRTATSQQWAGLLDDVRIYDTALNKSDLDTIRAAMAVPEPSVALLGGVALLCLLRRRRA